MGRMACLDQIPQHIFLMSHPPPSDDSSDASSDLHHTFYSPDTNSLPSNPSSPHIQDLPIRPTFTTA